MLPLRQEENKLHKKNFVNICRKKLNSDIKSYWKVQDHDHYTGKYRVLRTFYAISYKRANKIPVTLHNGSNNDYHLIIKESAKEFKRKFELLGENTEN